MKYYLIKIFYNKVAKAEDRPQPQAFNTLDEADKAFHNYMSQSILGATTGWVLAMIINPYGVVERVERWEEIVEPEQAEEDPNE